MTLILENPSPKPQKGLPPSLGNIFAVEPIPPSEFEGESRKKGRRPNTLKLTSALTDELISENPELMKATLAAEPPVASPATLAAQELAGRELARRNLLSFVHRFHHTYKAGWVHKLICRKLMKFMKEIEEGKSPRLMLFTPPRAGKSVLASEMFPAWLLGHHPNWEIVSASHTVSLAMDFSFRIRTLLHDKDYRSLFPDTQISPQSKAVDGWVTTANPPGCYTPVGVGTALVGKGCHCFPAGVPIRTKRGTIPIEQVALGDEVLAFDHAKNSLVFRPVQAIKVSRRSDLLKVVTTHGQSLTCTHDHPIYADGQYRAANQLKPGMGLVNVQLLRRSLPKTAVRHQEGPKVKLHCDLLFQGVQPGAPCHQACEEVSYLPETYLPSRSVSKRDLLLRCLSGASTIRQKACKVVSSLLDRVYLHVYAAGVLLQGLLGPTSCPRYGRAGQSQIYRWFELCPVFPRYETSYSYAGFGPLCVLQDDISLSGTSYRRGRAEQSAREFGYTLSELSYPTPQTDTVAVVERLRSDSIPVYDLQIAGTHNFFADEILVHNCLIIDDPVSGIEAADSDIIQQKNYDWYSSVARTRLAPGAGILIIQQRWNLNDLSGQILRRLADFKAEHPDLTVVEDWEIVTFPAIAQHDEYLTNDDRILHYPPSDRPATLVRRKGEALHPDRYPLHELQKLQYSLPPRHWSALYQQQPVPDEGAFFKKDFFRFEDQSPPAYQFPTYSAWDLALGTNKDNDWTVGLIGCMDYDGKIHILDMIRTKTNILDTASLILSSLKPYSETLVLTGIEYGPTYLAVMPALMRAMQDQKFYINLTDELKPVTNKRLRAKPAQDFLMSGNVILPHPTTQPWVQTFLNELLQFDAGVHDDIVDAFAWLVRMMANQATPRRPVTKNRQDPESKPWREKLKQYIRGSSGTSYMGT